MKRQRRLTLEEWTCDNCGSTTRLEKGEEPENWSLLPCPPAWQNVSSQKKPSLTFDSGACFNAWIDALRESSFMLPREPEADV